MPCPNRPPRNRSPAPRRLRRLRLLRRSKAGSGCAACSRRPVRTTCCTSSRTPMPTASPTPAERGEAAGRLLGPCQRRNLPRGGRVFHAAATRRGLSHSGAHERVIRHAGRSTPAFPQSRRPWCLRLQRSGGRGGIAPGTSKDEATAGQSCSSKIRHPDPTTPHHLGSGGAHLRVGCSPPRTNRSPATSFPARASSKRPASADRRSGGRFPHPASVPSWWACICRTSPWRQPITMTPCRGDTGRPIAQTDGIRQGELSDLEQAPTPASRIPLRELRLPASRRSGRPR